MDALHYIGAISVSYICYRLISHISFYLLPNISLDRWRKVDEKPWALVTGSSAGIGLGTAQELAIRGFNIVLLGHLRHELAEAGALIQAESPKSEVLFAVMDATSATSDEIEKAASDISTLPLTVLVNNVGGFPIKVPQIRDLVDYSGEELDRSLTINARFLAQVTRAFLPQLSRNGPSLIINVSSAARMGIPGIVPYSGCKGFIISWSKALSREMAAARVPVDILAVVPGDVQSQSNVAGLTPGTPAAREYAKVMLDRAGRAVNRQWVECVPFWPHAIQIGFIESLPHWLSQKLLLKTFEDKKKASELHRKQKVM
ncbi:3-ketoacyl-CoA reductase [Truncatella angustata]|uniref:3-ketoacyl-CoA reductase n=1 Tax=Truncatella angustata TaxID=152316 RepID=A0A9P8RJP1_9PEZI|nr:3-ketoacyl-CoA reductase [Truncatella angustata]KAH6647288.1 3-ketoacyl-CoA reductase [Truncatella angustata]